ncbi:MAG TPA: hypothetical protein VK518_16835 [Puia sp.]|nr:hypothetical protein [Puia sp.]
MEEPKDEVFSVVINPSRLSEFKSIYTTTKWIFGIGISCIILQIASAIAHATYTEPEKYRKSFFAYYLQLKLSNWNTLLYCGIYIIQLVVWLRFTGKMARGLESSDSVTFNQSFNHLRRYNLLFLLGSVVVLLLGILSLWAQIEFAQASAARK